LIRNEVKDLIASTGFAVITTKKCSHEFLFQYLFSSGIERQFYQLLVGSNYPAINSSDVRKLKIPLPPLPEQKAIAQVLSKADAAIHTTEKLIAQKVLRKKWLMQQLLTGKKRLMGFGGVWKENSYEKILKVVKRNFDWDENELYKLISVRRRSGGIFYREALYGHQILVKTLRTANEGDFLFSKMQILHGASALVTKEFDGAKISGSYIAVVPKDKKQLNMEFFQWYSQTPYFYHQTYISSYGVHIEKMTFDFDTFLQLEMKLPSIEEQTAIAQLLQAVDKEISILKAKAEKLREQKKGLMQKLLTGKVRLKINYEIK
jgi:type I restriction enzyme S subunit